MSNPTAVSLKQVVRDPASFEELVKARKHVAIFDEGRHFLVMAHYIHDMRDADDVTQLFFRLGFCHRPGEFPVANKSTDRFFGDTKQNVANMTAYPRTIMFLTTEGKPTMVIQVCVPGLRRTIASRMKAGLASLAMLRGQNAYRMARPFLHRA